MRGVRYRLAQAHITRWGGVSLAAVGLLVMLSLLMAQGSAAHSGETHAAVTLSFTVTVIGGTAPSDSVFWVCPDAQTDGTGCEQMNGQGNGPYTYQLAATSDTTYRHLIIEWTDGRQPSSNGKDPLPQVPVHVACSYPNVAVGALETDSFSCPVDFTKSTVTPSPAASTSPQATPTDPSDSSTPGSDTTSTLVTGLQVIIGVGLVLLVILLIILMVQRLGGRRR